MKRFFYRAKDKKGNLVTGEVEASSETSAARLIRNKDLVVLSIKPARETIGSLVRRFRERITPSDVSTFTRQLSTMVNAGLPITEALSVLRVQSQPSMQRVVSQILAEVEGGESLSGAISRHPTIFSPTYIALIKAGEVGGVMETVLVRLADNLEKQEEFKGKVKGALTYPAIIVIGMFVVGLAMMIFVIPRLTSLYNEFNATLPLPTKILIGISNFFFTFWPVALVAIAGAIYGTNLYSKTTAGRRKIDELILKLPIFGELQKEVLLTELTRTLSLMVGSGVSLLEGLNVTAQVVSNSVMSGALTDAAKEVEKGFPISFSFARHPEAFPYILTQMIAVGEETGKMEEVLAKVSHIFEVESDQRVKTLTSAVEPVIMVVLGVGVGFLVIAIILPIYNLTSQF